jgi:WD40 repeat protein
MTSVFLSYARADDESFVRRLHDDLCSQGFSVWWDRESLMSRGLTYHQEIKDAIREGIERLVYVAGPAAARSSHVREEWRIALDLDKHVIPILRAGEFEEIPEPLQGLHCDDFRDDAKYVTQLAKLVENLRRPPPPLGALIGVPSLPAHFLGRPDLMRRVKDALLVDLQKPVVITAATSRVGVQGMGGIGKSVLAAALARDTGIRRSYPDGVIWASVGQQPNLAQLQRDLAAHLGNSERFENEVQGRSVLRQLLLEKAVLLVLDDVWNASEAEAFDVLGPRCRALVTTRDAGVLHSLHGDAIPVSLFTEHEALQLLADTTGIERAALPEEARGVVTECGCLPLAVALCGGMVRKHGGDWRNVLMRLRRADLEKIADRQAINPEHESIWRAMVASVDVLPAGERQRFVELAVFHASATVPAAAVTTFWAHTGGLDEFDAGDALVGLAERSLIRLDRAPGESGKDRGQVVVLHDLLKDLLGRLAGDPKPLHATLLDAYARKCPAGWPTGPNDGHFFQRLAGHLVEAGRAEDLRSLLWDAAYLQAKVVALGPQPLIEDYDLVLGEDAAKVGEPAADGDERLRLLQDALRLSAHVLARDPHQLAGQLHGRLLGENRGVFSPLLDQVAGLQKRPWLRPLTRSLHPPGAALLRTLTGRSYLVSAVAITPDGRHAVSASADRTLTVWDLASGREECTLTGHSRSVNAVAITPDGRHAVSASEDRLLKVWDLASGREERTLAGHSDWVTAVAITPDGLHAVSASHDKTLKVWDLASGREERTLAGHSDWVNAVAITPDGRRTVSVSHDLTLKVWDLTSGREERTLAGHSAPVSDVAITPDGRHAVSASGDRTLKSWDLASGREEHTFAGHASLVSAVAITPDGRQAVSASADQTLKVWDLASGHEERTLAGHYESVCAVAITPDGLHAVSASGQTLKVWDLATGRKESPPEGHSDWVSAVAITPDGLHAVSASRDRTLKVWNLASWREERTLAGHSDLVNAVAITPDGRYAVSASGDQTLKSWDLASGREERTLAGHSGWVNAVAITPDGRRAVSASDDRTLKVWDLAGGREERTLTGHSRSVNAVAVTPDGQHAVSASGDQTLKVWDLASGGEVRALAGHSDWVSAVAITPDGRHAVSASVDQTLRLWDLASGCEECTLAGHPFGVSAVAISPDGRYAVSTSFGGRLGVCGLLSRGRVAAFTGEAGLPGCAIAPDGRTIVAGETSGRIHFLRLEGID